MLRFLGSFIMGVVSGALCYYGLDGTPAEAFLAYLIGSAGFEISLLLKALTA
jgi:hypothetical protein